MASKRKTDKDEEKGPRKTKTRDSRLKKDYLSELDAESCVVELELSGTETGPELYCMARTEIDSGNIAIGKSLLDAALISLRNDQSTPSQKYFLAICLLNRGCLDEEEYLSDQVEESIVMLRSLIESIDEDKTAKDLNHLDKPTCYIALARALASLVKMGEAGEERAGLLEDLISFIKEIEKQSFIDDVRLSAATELSVCSDFSQAIGLAATLCKEVIACGSGNSVRAHSILGRALAAPKDASIQQLKEAADHLAHCPENDVDSNVMLASVLMRVGELESDDERAMETIERAGKLYQEASKARPGDACLAALASISQ